MCTTMGATFIGATQCLHTNYPCYEVSKNYCKRNKVWIKKHDADIRKYIYILLKCASDTGTNGIHNIFLRPCCVPFHGCFFFFFPLSFNEARICHPNLNLQSSRLCSGLRRALAGKQSPQLPRTVSQGLGTWEAGKMGG